MGFALCGVVSHVLPCAFNNDRGPLPLLLYREECIGACDQVVAGHGVEEGLPTMELQVCFGACSCGLTSSTVELLV